ncbi:MAG: M3 family oligoendopeptidase [Ardenticatenales bacterium]|nr:M3 family oligoendopeptidase [Ardenticatenales bacterium]
MKLAIISDIHGNLHALEAVLRDIETLRVDRVIANGDMVNRGPNNVAVMERLAAEGHELTLGNHDDLMRKWIDRDDDIPASWFDDPFWKATAWSARQVAEAGWIEQMRRLPMTLRIEAPGAPSLLISHGSPRHYREGYGALLNDEQLAEIVQMHPADIYVGSHTHRMMERHWGAHILLNSGSVGAPFNGDPRAQYLVLTLEEERWQWEFRAVSYDREAALSAFEELGYLAEGDLSAQIFYEELIYARPLYAPYWMWAESQEKPMHWPTWHEFHETYQEFLVLPDGATLIQSQTVSRGNHLNLSGAAMTESSLNPLDWTTMQPHFDALLATELTQDSVRPWLRRWSDLEAQVEELGAQVYREVSENIVDEEAEKRFLLFLEEVLPKSSIANQALKEKLLAFEAFTPYEDTEQLLKRFRADAAIFREENVPLRSELLKLGNEYEKIIGAMTVDWEGQEETMPQIEVRLQDLDRVSRERAWQKMMARYAQERETLDKLYLEMLAMRRQVARNAGLASFREYQWQEMGRFDYTPEDCFTFHDAIEHEVVPFAAELYKSRCEKLGLDTLRPWDTAVEVQGEPLTPFAEAAELEEGGYRIFEQVDPVLASHYAIMRDGYLDLASRPNKAPGGYCNSFPVTGKPYIFMNAAGTHRDVSTLLHEGGHAFHFMESKDQPLVWNIGGPMEFCEVASMAMELLSAPYLAKSKGGFYEEEDARRAYASHLREIVLFLPYMAVVDAFQHWVYVEAPENVTTNELDAKWSETWDRFMKGIDYQGLQTEKETGWHRKAHIFTSPFYYVEYGLAQLGALQVWRTALQDQAKAVADYRAALALGDTRSLRELFEAAGATFSFDRQTIGELMRLIREQLDSLEGQPA